MKNLEELQRELSWRTKQKKLKATLEKLQLLQHELDKRMTGDLPGRCPIEDCYKLPHPCKLPQYTISYNMLGKWKSIFHIDLYFSLDPFLQSRFLWKGSTAGCTECTL